MRRCESRRSRRHLSAAARHADLRLGAHPLQVELLLVGLALRAGQVVLAELRRGFFSEGIGHRACVVVTDGESSSFTVTPERRTCTFFLIRVGQADERIFGSDGRLEAQYRPDPTATQSLEQLAAATGGRVWPESRLADAASALRMTVDTGPTQSIPASDETRSLAPYPAGLALALTALLALPATRRRRIRSAGTVSSPVAHSR